MVGVCVVKKSATCCKLVIACESLGGFEVWVSVLVVERVSEWEGANVGWWMCVRSEEAYLLDESEIFIMYVHTLSRESELWLVL